jgi:hypothetical protein
MLPILAGRSVVSGYLTVRRKNASKIVVLLDALTTPGAFLEILQPLPLPVKNLACQK